MASPVASPRPACVRPAAHGFITTATTIPVAAVRSTSPFGMRRVRRSDAHARARSTTNDVLLTKTGVDKANTFASIHSTLGYGRLVFTLLKPLLTFEPRVLIA